MKKFLGIVLIFCSLPLFAGEKNVNVSAGAAYMNYFLLTDIDSSGGATAYGQVKTGSVQEDGNAFGFSLDMRAHYFYAMLQIAFPQKNVNDLLHGADSANLPLKTGAYVLDMQAGAGYTFFKDRPVNIFTGGGIGFYAKDTSVNLKNADYIRTDLMFGAGVNTVLSFYPLSFLGMYIGAADTVYFVPIKTVREVSAGGLKGGAAKTVIANNFVLKTGVIFRL